MTKLELALLAGAYAIKNSRFGKNDGGFVKGVFSPNPEEIRFNEAAEILCETVDEQNVFTCPVKPGQTVYQTNPDEGRIYEDKVLQITFGAVGWMVECENKLCFWAPAWNTLIFRTREEAEKKLKEVTHDE